MKFVLADSGGRSVGEPRAYSRSLSLGISRTGTASFRITDRDPLWEFVIGEDSRLKVYDSGDALRFYGPVIGVEESASGAGSSVAVTAADLSWILGHRYFAKDTSGRGVEYAASDPAAIALDILADVNADQATGITAGTAGSFTTRTVRYLWKRALDAIQELGGIASSYEWGLRYTDSAIPVTQLDLLAALGTDRSAEVFLEYGCGKRNVRDFSRSRGMDVQANKVYGLASASTLTASAEDTTSQGQHGLLEDVIAIGDLPSSSLVSALVTAHVGIRAEPRVIVSMTPFHATGPVFGVDYEVGDFLTARAVVRNSARVNGIVRLWGVDVATDESGNESATMRLVPE